MDAPALAKRLHERAGKVQLLPDHMQLPNLAPPPNSEAVNSKAPVRTYNFAGRDPSNSWQSVIPWVKANTRLEIWLKGSEWDPTRHLVERL